MPTKRRPHSAKTLAAAFVSDRFAFAFEYAELTEANGDFGVRSRFDAIVEAALAEDWPGVTREMVEELAAAGHEAKPSIHEETLLATEQAHARAGFLVGLEVGRRFGGAR